MRISKFTAVFIGLGLMMAVFVFRASTVHAQNLAGPPTGWYPAYNWAPGGSGWNYSVPQDFRYPPAVGWNPISNTYDGTNPSGNIEDLCRGVKKLLVPNMGAVFPSSGVQNGPWTYTTYDPSVYIEYWVATYQCWNSAADWGSASYWGTGMEITNNGVPASINLGTYDGAANDPDKGGWGGNWAGWGGTIGLSPGNNHICMKVWGNYAWTQGGNWTSEPFGPLGFGCYDVNYTRAPDSTIYVSKYNPPSHPANGDFASVDAEINTTEACIRNNVGLQFACNTDPGSNNTYSKNGWRKDGIWYSDNDYQVLVNVRPGWRVTGTNRGNATCTLPGGRGQCYVTVHVEPGSFNYVDFWFDIVPQAVCTPFTILDPNNSNNPYNGNPEVGQPVILSFQEPSNLPPGTPHYAINGISSGPAGIVGLGPTYGPTNIGNRINTGNITAGSPNTYTVNYTLSWDGTYAGNLNCSGTVSFTSKPYMRVYGNDVRAGGNMKAGGVCAAPENPLATILTFNRRVSATASQEVWAGSATQFGAFALGEIANYMSAGQNSPRTNVPPGDSQARPVLDLTFGNFDPANSISSHGETNSSLFDLRKVEGYGGVSGMQGCIDDYFTAIASGGGTAAPAAIASNRVINGQVAEYRVGDVFINANIDYPASWSDGNVPSYYLVVVGNIYISGNVDRLAGVYIAQEHPAQPNSGRIYTCSQGASTLYAASQIYSNCNRKLTVNGAFIAKQVKFLRSRGSTNIADPYETPASSNAAEVFDFNPAIYMGVPNSSLKRGSAKVQYDFITSLPPIL